MKLQNRITPLLRRALFCSPLVLALGCMVDAAGVAPDETVGEVVARLAAASNTALWDQNANVVDICWVNAGLQAEKDQVKALVTAAWQANSGLVFTWPASANTTCPFPNVPSHYMPLYLNDVADWGGVCAIGYGGRLDSSNCGGLQCQCAFNTGKGDPTLSQFMGETAVHEIGHGIGLPHEHQRMDRPADIATTCVDPNAQADPTRWTDPNNPEYGNYFKDPSLFLLTRYDGLDSIMSYCRDENRDGQADWPGSPQVSELDALGIEMLYPKNYRRKPFVQGGIGNADWSTFVVRTDQYVTFLVDWQVRGGLPGVLHNPQWASTSGYASTLLNPRIWVTSTALFSVELDDVLMRHHSPTSTKVVASNALHTSIILPAISLL